MLPACFMTCFSYRGILFCLFCQLIACCNHDHSQPTSEEHIRTSDSQSPHLQEAAANTMAENHTKRHEENPHGKRMFHQIPDDERLDEFMDKQLGVVYRGSQSQAHVLKGSSYLLQLYSALQATVGTPGQNDMAGFLTMRSHSARLKDPSLKQPLRQRYMSFKLNDEYTSNIKRYEIVVKLRKIQLRTNYDNFYLKVFVDGGKYFKAQRYEKFVIFEIATGNHRVPTLVYARQNMLASSLGVNSTLQLTRRNQPVLVTFENKDFNPLL